jgi:hypothetical protein
MESRTSTASTTKLDYLQRESEKRRSHEHVHYRVHAVAVPLPHRPELRLTSNIPDFEGNVASPHLAEVKRDSRHDVLAPLYE